MKKIEKEYNKRFSNQQLPNDDFDADGLWDAISDNLDKEPRQSPRGWWGAKRLMGLALISIFIAVLTCYQLGIKNEISSNSVDEKGTIIENKINPVKEFASNNRLPISTNSATEILSRNPKQSESLKNNQIPVSKTENEKSNAETHPKSDETIFHVVPKKHFKQKQTNLFNRSETSERQTINNQRSVKDMNVGSSIINSSKKKNQKDIKNPMSQETLAQSSSNSEAAIGLTLNALPSLSTLLIVDETAEYFPILDKPYHEIDKKEVNALAWQFSLLGGVNNFLFNYSASESTSIADLRDQTDTSQWGNNFGFKTAIVFKDTWVLSSGLEYQNLYARFDLTRITNTQVLKENEILKIWIDSETEETLNSIIGDTLVDAITTRTIVHHNRYQQFTLPLDFGFQKFSHGFIYGIQAGASFNYISTQSGKTIDPEGEIVNFDSDSVYTPFRSFHIGLRLSPLVGYQISNHWALTFQPQWAWNPQIGFDDPNLRLSTQQVNLILGVRYLL